MWLIWLASCSLRRKYLLKKEKWVTWKEERKIKVIGKAYEKDYIENWNNGLKIAFWVWKEYGKKYDLGKVRK